MKPELSRRVAKIMNVRPVLDLSIDGRAKLANAVNRAKTFKDLSKTHQKLIVSAERTARKFEL